MNSSESSLRIAASVLLEEGVVRSLAEARARSGEIVSIEGFVQSDLPEQLQLSPVDPVPHG